LRKEYRSFGAARFGCWFIFCNFPGTQPFARVRIAPCPELLLLH